MMRGVLDNLRLLYTIFFIFSRLSCVFPYCNYSKKKKSFLCQHTQTSIFSEEKGIQTYKQGLKPNNNNNRPKNK